MGNKIELKLEKREAFGKKVAKLREQSIIPGVVYGSELEAVAVQADEALVNKVVREAGFHTPVHITLGGKKRIAMIKDIEKNHVKGKIIHVSFHAVRANEMVVAEVPIHLEGESESAAVRSGLIIIQAMENVEVKALPMHLPEALIAPVSGLVKEGDKVLISDIELPEGVEIVDNDDGREGTDDDEHSILGLTVATVYEPGALAAANDAAGGDAETDDAEQVVADKGDDKPVEKKA